VTDAQACRRRWTIVCTVVCAAILEVLFPPRYVLYSYCPIWYGGLFNVPRLVVQLACTATLGWAVYVRLVGSAPPPGLPRVLLLVGVLVLAALVVVGVILMRLMSLS
jgi:hypothetical protein